MALSRTTSTPEDLHFLMAKKKATGTIWGHLTLIQLEQLVEPIFTGFPDTTNPWDVPTNADIAERTQLQGGVVSYTHPTYNLEDPYDGPYTSKGLPVDMALGRIDTLDVMGFGYDPTLPLWYKLLNCGFRLPAAAGTDCFLSHITSYPPGWGRTYVKLNGKLRYRDWAEGQRAGRTVVSKGPMLEFSVAGKEPGDTLRLDAPRSLKVRARGWAQYPLERLELVYNGNIIATGELNADSLEATLDQQVKLDSSGWIAARVAGTSPPDYAAYGQAAAHTSPVYVEVKDHPLDARAEAEFFLKWIDRLETDLRRRNRVPIPSVLAVIESQLNAAREVYRGIARGVRPAIK